MATRTGRGAGTRLRLTCLGAARSVTGSLHFFDYTSEDGSITRFFLDMGLNQEREAHNFENRLPRGIKPADVDFGIFSHAHIDHTGYFPRLFREGFRGRVYATAPTRDLAAILLPDSGYLQEEEARRANARARRAHEAAGSGRGRRVRAPKMVQPLYTQLDATTCLSAIDAVEYDVTHRITADIAVRFSHASHILGAAVVTLIIGNGSKRRRVVFTGDIGRPSYPVLRDVEQIDWADYVICEGTYGNREHSTRDRQAALASIINEAHQRALKPHKKFGHGVIVIPAFAVGRVQSVLFDLRALMESRKIPVVPVFLDSPLAIKATAIYRRYPHLLNDEAQALIGRGKDPFAPPVYAELTDYQMSQRLDSPADRPIIIIGSSGMASGGRVLNHLQYRLPGEQNTVVFVGFQGQGTLGRQLTVDRPETVKVMGEEVRVRAAVHLIEDYSGHGDYRDITRWLSGFTSRPRQVFLVHGESEQLEALKLKLESSCQLKVTVPELRERFDLK